ncbi:hypothetical protein [Mesoplasma seiffertii]|uniref:hypothetical protein n=1 Tax=Mesoplasma seiffertii TaxID=28224 RepID=UPI00047B29A2|nr:hypothetical protein [Mesoplasma seiffertii]
MTKFLLFITCLFKLLSFSPLSVSSIQKTDSSEIATKKIDQPIVKTFSVPKRWPLWNTYFNYSFTINLTKFDQELIQAGAISRIQATFIDEIENDYDFWYKQYRYIKSVNEIDLKVDELNRRETQNLKDLPIVHVHPGDIETFVRNLKYFFAVEINQQRHLLISIYKPKDLVEHSTFAFKARKITLKDVKISFLKPYTSLKDNQLVVNLATNYFDRYETNFNDLINSRVDELLKNQTQNLQGFKKFYQTPQFSVEDLRHFSALNFENPVTVTKLFLKTSLTQKNPYLNAMNVPKLVINYQPIYEIPKMFKNTRLVTPKKLSKLTKTDVIELLEDYKFMFFKYLDLVKISDAHWKIIVQKPYLKVIKGHQELHLKSTFKEEIVVPKVTPDPIDETPLIDKIDEDKSNDEVSNQKATFSDWQIGLGLAVISLGLLFIIFLWAFIKKLKKSKKKG